MGRCDCFLSGVPDLTNASQNKCVSAFVSNLREFKGDSVCVMVSLYILSSEPSSPVVARGGLGTSGAQI